MKRILTILPLLILALFVGVVGWRLANPADERIQSRLVGKPVPQFSLSPAIATKPGLATADMGSGTPRLVNVFASWCVPCIAEAPVLMELKRRGVVLDAIAIRDRPEDVAAFLERHGDPFDRIGADPESAVQLALGSSGVPESFIVDGRGIIRYQHMGPIDPSDIPQILAQWEAAK